MRLSASCLLALSIPLAAQTQWDILGNRTIVTPFNQAGLFGAALAANGDVIVSGSSCNAPGAIKPTISYGNTSACGPIVIRISPAGATVFAVQLGGADNAGTLLLDPAGNVFVGGNAESAKFLTTPGAYLTVAPEAATSPNYSANFACKLNASDGTPLFCTFLDDTAQQLTLDPAGDLLFVKSVSTTSTSYTIAKLNQAGAKSMESVPVSGTITAIAPNPDGTFYLAGGSQMLESSGVQLISYYGKFDPKAGFLFEQSFPSGAGFSIILQPSVGPVVSGNFSGNFPSGFEIRQYASDGQTIVYDRSLPSISPGSISVVDGGLVISANSSNPAMPLLHNLHVCGQVSTSGTSENPVMLRLDSTGAIVQSTWLSTSYFGPLTGTGSGEWSALGSVSGNPGLYAPNAYVQVLSLGPNPNAQTQTIGCITDLAQRTNSIASPGLLVALIIENDAPIGPAAAQLDSNGRFPTALAGITVTFDNVPAPLLALSGQQLNAVVPFSVEGKSSTEMCLTSLLLTASCATLRVQPFAPAVLATANEDGTLNSPTNPARPGSIVTFYLIGLGPLSPSVPDGTIVDTPLPALTAPVSVEFATSLGIPGMFPPPSPPVVAQITYAGPAPFEVAGVYQINAVVPTAALGSATIVVGPVTAPIAGTAASVSLSNTH